MSLSADKRIQDLFAHKTLHRTRNGVDNERRSRRPPRRCRGASCLVCSTRFVQVGRQCISDHCCPTSHLTVRRQYRQAAHYNVTHLRRQAFYSLQAAHVDLLCASPFSIPDTLGRVDDAIDSNADIAESILNLSLQAFGIDSEDDSWEGTASTQDLDKARSTIHQLYRDWSAEGQAERDACMTPIIKALEAFAETQTERVRVLVPGAGLGRLVYDLYRIGFDVEGNEISYHQIMASNFLLNYAGREAHTLYPWALSFSNHLNRENQLQAVRIPDISPAEESTRSDQAPKGAMSMSAGDFCVVYRRPEYESSFDAVATCFFIDTAPNVINYVETVKHILRPGGVWVNLGPLLWHFESTPTPAEKEQARDLDQGKPDTAPLGIGDPGSFELSNDEVLALLTQFNFEVEEVEHIEHAAAGYIQDRKSMLQNIYRPVFWQARKVQHER